MSARTRPIYGSSGKIVGYLLRTANGWKRQAEAPTRFLEYRAEKRRAASRRKVGRNRRGKPKRGYAGRGRRWR